MAIKAHWISRNWESRDALLDFPNLKGRHTGENICEVFRNSLRTFNIGLEKVYAITTDNASNNDKFFQQLESGSKIDDTTEFIENESRVRCSAHVLNLVMQMLLTHLDILPENNLNDEESDTEEEDTERQDFGEDNIIAVSHASAIKKLRKFVRVVRRSTQKREKLKEACDFHKMKECQLIIDVKTRWNSTFCMIKRAFTLKLPILTMCSADKDLRKLILSE
jgi:hypothetical protein